MIKAMKKEKEIASVVRDIRIPGVLWVGQATVPPRLVSTGFAERVRFEQRLAGGDRVSQAAGPKCPFSFHSRCPHLSLSPNQIELLFPKGV